MSSFTRSSARRALQAAGAAALIAAALAAGGPATATAPTNQDSQIDTTRRSTSTSNACGVDVYFRLQGTLDVRLFRNRDGLVEREQDLNRDLTVTWFAPALGTSFSYKIAGPQFWDYPGGATLGSPAIFKSVGSSDKVPGVNADAGQAVYTGVVADFSPEGVPLVDLEDMVKLTGSPQGSTPASRCAALR